MSLRSALAASEQLKGIACIVVSGAIFAFTDGLSKLLTARYPPGEILFFRSVFVVVPVTIMVWWRGGLESLRIVNWQGQALRGVMVVLTSFLFIVAVKHMPLADITAILFVSPLVLTALAPVFLGEHVGWRRWTAVVVGFCGTLFMIRPSGDAMLWPALLALGITVLIAFRDIITRRLSRTDTANGIMVCSTACVAAGGLATLPFGWVMPDAEGLALLMLTGMLQGVAQYFLVYAFVYGEAVVVTPFRYFTLIWATVWGYLLFGDVPGLQTFAGATVVIGSGLYIFYREARLSQRADPATKTEVKPTTARW